MPASRQQAAADEAFQREVEEAFSSGCTTWGEVGERMGVAESAIHARRNRIEQRTGQRIGSPTGKLAHNSPQPAAKSIPVDLIREGVTLDGLKVRGTSTLVDEAGQARLQWVKTTRDDEAREAYYRGLGEALAREVPRVEPVKASGAWLKDLMACYPIGDGHLGMYSWAGETGEDWDLAIAERTHVGAMATLVDGAPAAEDALIVNLGDWLHYDSMAAVTPSSGHQLDADSRPNKMIRVAEATLRTCIDTALRKHRRVRVLCVIGNHDPMGAQWLALALTGRYEKEPRVTIDRTPGVFQYVEHGRCLIGVHHGHKVKPAQLPGVLATDQAEAWGRTKHRYWWLGHVHHQRVFEFPGCVVESFNTLAARDAYAYSGGWRSRRQMQCIVLHREHGEVARSTVNVGMLEAAA